MLSAWKICFQFEGTMVENMTSVQPYYVGSCAMVLYLAPIVCVLGFCLNALCIALFVAIDTSRTTVQRSSLVPYLTALCTFDAAQLFMSIFMLITPGYQMFFQYPRHSFLGKVSSYSVVLLYPLGMAANYASIWTITLICVQRYRAICHPLATRARTSSSMQHRRRNAFAWVLLIGTAAVLVNLIKYWEYIPVQRYDTTVNRSWLLLNESKLLLSPVYNVIQNQVLYPLFLYIIPMAALTVLNTKIIIAIYTARKTLPQATCGGSTSTEQKLKSRERREHRSAFMIITIIVLFFACHTGGVIMRYVARPAVRSDASLVEFENYIRSLTKWMFFRDLSNFLFNVNCTLNPFVYFVFTKHFSDLKCVASKTLLNRHSSSVTPRPTPRQVVQELVYGPMGVPRNRGRSWHVTSGRKRSGGSNVGNSVNSMTSPSLLRICEAAGNTYRNSRHHSHLSAAAVANLRRSSLRSTESTSVDGVRPHFYLEVPPSPSPKVVLPRPKSESRLLSERRRLLFENGNSTKLNRNLIISA